MFPFHAAFSLGMISLAAGTALYAWSSSRPEGTGMGFSKLIGILVIVFSITSTLCTVYYGVRYWSEGYFQSPIAKMQCIQPQNRSMMNSNIEMTNMMNNQMNINQNNLTKNSTQ